MAALFHNPVATYFGSGSLDLITALTTNQRVALVTFPEARGLGLIDKVQALLGDRLVYVFEDVQPNPDVAQLRAVYEDFWSRAEHCDTVFALGGGSAIDTAKALIAAKKPGAVVNLASSAVRGAVRGVHYSASKGGVVSMTRALALELAPYGIRVNAIAPGLTDTAQPRYGNSDDELVEMARTTIPLGGKLLTPDQIARTAVYLASDESSATTGQVLHVNGGSYMP